MTTDELLAELNRLRALYLEKRPGSSSPLQISVSPSWHSGPIVAHVHNLMPEFFPDVDKALGWIADQIADLPHVWTVDDVNATLGIEPAQEAAHVD